MICFVEYCLNNVDPATRAALRASAPATLEDVCLQRCGLCAEEPFLLVDGRLLRGAPHQTLLDQATAQGGGERRQ